jgi:O-antigen ligase
MLTLRHLLALIPPAAMALACIQMDALQKRRLAFLWTGGALVGLFIGAAQLAMGPDSGLYFYATTNLGSSVGLFSNRNHHASLLLGAMPLAAALALTTPHGAGRGSRQLLGLLAVLLMAAAVVAVQSRAAVLLLAPVLLGMMAVAWRLMAGRRVSGRPAVVALLGAAAALAAVVTLSPGLSRFTSSPAEDARFAAWPAVFAAMGEHQPLGAGIGAFDTAYRAAEPLEQVSPIYLNHAHNDYLELALEAGWLAAAALAVFVVWFVRRGVAIWRATGPSQGGLAATAWIAAATALAHSAVDYPLRTLTMATFFAFCCAVVASAATKPQTGD